MRALDGIEPDPIVEYVLLPTNPWISARYMIRWGMREVHEHRVDVRGDVGLHLRRDHLVRFLLDKDTDQPL